MKSPCDVGVTGASFARDGGVRWALYAGAMMTPDIARNLLLTPSPRPVIMTPTEHPFYTQTGQALSARPARSAPQAALGRRPAMHVQFYPRPRRRAIPACVTPGACCPTQRAAPPASGSGHHTLGALRAGVCHPVVFRPGRADGPVRSDGLVGHGSTEARADASTPSGSYYLLDDTGGWKGQVLASVGGGEP